MNEDIQKMLRMAELIRDATQVGENTAVRVGTEIYDIVVELSRMLAMMNTIINALQSRDASQKELSSRLSSIESKLARIESQAKFGRR